MKKITAVLLAFCIASFTFAGCKESEEASATSVLESTRTTEPETSAKPTKEKVQISDRTLGEIWITEAEGVDKNKLVNANFNSDGNFKYYQKDGKKASRTGIDISSFSGSIDWKKVKESGVEFAMIRIGGRGYGEEGTLYSDDNAIDYINGAKSVGIKVGGYFFSQAVNKDEAVAEADYVKSILGDIKLDYPLAFDWEIIEDDEARTDNVTNEEVTECAVAFCNRARELGYIPMIYSTSKELYYRYDLSQLADVDIWYSEYEDTPEFYYEFSMWQYSLSGAVDGIEGDVDLNLCFTEIADYS